MGKKGVHIDRRHPYPQLNTYLQATVILPLPIHGHMPPPAFLPSSEVRLGCFLRERFPYQENRLTEPCRKSAEYYRQVSSYPVKPFLLYSETGHEIRLEILAEENSANVKRLYQRSMQNKQHMSISDFQQNIHTLSLVIRPLLKKGKKERMKVRKKESETQAWYTCSKALAPATTESRNGFTSIFQC